MASTATDTIQQPLQREVSIFWDYENLPLPSWAKAADASKSIVKLVSKHGRIVDRRLYFDFSDSRGQQMWSSLDSSGFDLVNTPRRNQKETLDKKLIADVLTFAWDSAVRNDNRKPCVVLLTSDGDYAYCLSKLRDRGVLSMVMYGSDDAVASILRDSADIPLDFQKDVLAEYLPKHDTRSEAPPSTTSSKTASVEKKSSEKSISSEKKSSTDKNAPSDKKGNSDKNVSSEKKSTSDKNASSEKKSNSDKNDSNKSTPKKNENSSNENDVVVLCKSIGMNQIEETEWFLGSQVGADFRALLGPSSQDRKERYKAARALALKKELIEQGRKPLLGGMNKGDIVPVTANNPKNYSKEDYLRLTKKGFRLIGKDVKGGPKLKEVPEDPSSLDAILLCKILVEGQHKSGEWLSSGGPASAFSTAKGSTPALERKEKFRLSRKLAVEKGWMEQGRKVLCGPTKGEIEKVDDGPFDRGYYSLEDYLRVTTAGEKIGMDQTTAKHSYAGSITQKNGSTSFSSYGDEADGRADYVGLCKTILKLGAKNEWVQLSQIGTSFASEYPDISVQDQNNILQKAWSEAHEHGYVEEGRRILCGPKKNEVEKMISDVSLDSDYYSTEQYLRLTKEGIEMSSVQKTSRYIFLKNVARGAKIHDVVKYLEQEHNCPVARGYTTEIKGGVAPYRFARLEMISAEVSAKLVALSKSSKLILMDRKIEASFDKYPTTKYSGNPNFYYEKEDRKDYKESSSIHSVTKASMDSSISLESDKMPSDAKNTSQLFIKNIPKSKKIEDLVQFIEDSHACVVTKAKLEPGPMYAAFCFARVVMESNEQAQELVELSKKSHLMLEDRQLEIIVDKFPSEKAFAGAGTYVYRRVSKESIKEDTLAMCKIIHKNTEDSSWIEGGALGYLFKDALGPAINDEDIKQRYKNARSQGCSEGLLEVGRRKLESGSKGGSVEPVSRNVHGGGGYSQEIYLRITKKGKKLISSSTETIKGDQLLNNITNTTENMVMISQGLENYTSGAESQHQHVGFSMHEPSDDMAPFSQSDDLEILKALSSDLWEDINSTAMVNVHSHE